MDCLESRLAGGATEGDDKVIDRWIDRQLQPGATLGYTLTAGALREALRTPWPWPAVRNPTPRRVSGAGRGTARAQASLLRYYATDEWAAEPDLSAAYAFVPSASGWLGATAAEQRPLPLGDNAWQCDGGPAAPLWPAHVLSAHLARPGDPEPLDDAAVEAWLGELRDAREEARRQEARQTGRALAREQTVWDSSGNSLAPVSAATG